jgi:hypothetical protein
MNTVSPLVYLPDLGIYLYFFHSRDCVDVAGIFLFFSSSPVNDFPLVWSVFHNIGYYCIGSIFHIWEKTCSLWLSEPGYLHLQWSSPVPSIYLQMTKFHSILWLNKMTGIFLVVVCTKERLILFIRGSSLEMQIVICGCKPDTHKEMVLNLIFFA